MSKYIPNKIYLHGDVDCEMFTVLSQGLDEYVDTAPKDFKGYLDIELISDGGAAYDALAMYDRIVNCPLNIRITCHGLVASAAVLILAAGNYRIMTKNSWVMVHEDSWKLKGKTSDLERDVAHCRRLETQWCKLFEDSTRANFQVWSRLHRKETYLTPKECKALGLIEEIE